jgi:hypothetical protein
MAGEASLNTYGPSGDSQATFILPAGFSPFSRFAYDGRHVFLKNKNSIFIFRPDGSPAGTFSLDTKTVENDWSGPFLAAEGKELWFFDRKQKAIQKYAIPAPLTAP